MSQPGLLPLRQQGLRLPAHYGRGLFSRTNAASRCVPQAMGMQPACRRSCPSTTPSAPVLPRQPTGRALQRLAAGSSSLQPSGFDKFVEALTVCFPLWVCLAATMGIAKPQALACFKPELFTWSLGFLMLSMGLTLTVENFRDCLARPKPIIVGYLAQYLVKPFLGFLIAKILNLSPPLATGLILVSCCPGGQASNVATYIVWPHALACSVASAFHAALICYMSQGHGDVALSVLMTTASTLGAIFMTPLLTQLLAGTLVPVDAYGLAVSTFQVVLMPTVVGVLANELLPGVVARIRPLLPLLGVALTTLLCATPVAQVSSLLRTDGLDLCVPVAILHALAFAMGYFVSKLAGFSEVVARTVSIETGMQSAALGFLLARTHFADPLVAVPSAVSVVFMAIGGSGLAVFWRSRPPTAEPVPLP